MIGPRRHFSLLSHAWLVATLSVAALAGLGVLLWSPWDRRSQASGEPLLLYCAAGLSRPMSEIIAGYEKEQGVTIQVTYNTSGTLLSTIRGQHDHPDLYLSNDLDNMRNAQRKFGVVAETIPVATNYPVLIVNKGTYDRLKKQGKPITSARDLLSSDLKVVLASESASIGKMTKRILQPLGIWAKLEELRKTSNRVSEGGTVEQVAQAVALQENYAGVVWSSVAHQHESKLAILTPPEFEGFKEQALVGVLTKSKKPTAALQFARYLTARDKGMEVLRRHQFEPIADADSWEKSPQLILSAGAMLRPGVEKAIKDFEQREGVKVTTHFAGCGALVTQMKALKKGDSSEKFPDAYFACDAPFLTDVQDWFGPPVTVSQNDVVLVVHKGNPKAVKPSVQELTRPDLKVGLPHPKNSALGKLVDDFLKARNWHSEVYSPNGQERVIHSDAAHDLIVKMRTAPHALDLVVVYRSNALSTPTNVEKHLDVIDLEYDMRATQPFAVAKETRHHYLVQRLLDAIVAEHSAERFRRLGFRWVHEEK